MTPPTYPTRTHTTTRSLTYSYTHIQPTSPSNLFILFLHGFPSSSHDWHHQIAYFETLGYGIIAPDLLGFEGTSKPPSMDFYKFKDMASDLEEILALRSISPIRKVIGMGHDWGSLMLSRLVNYYPELFEKLAFLDVGYLPPNGPAFDFQTVRAINSQIKRQQALEFWGIFCLWMRGVMSYWIHTYRSMLSGLSCAKMNSLGRELYFLLINIRCSPNQLCPYVTVQRITQEKNIWELPAVFKNGLTGVWKLLIRILLQARMWNISNPFSHSKTGDLALQKISTRCNFMGLMKPTIKQSW